MFGDPLNGTAIVNVVSSKVKTYCATGDDVCKGMFVITETHLSYGSDAADAAEFVKTTIGT